MCFVSNIPSTLQRFTYRHTAHLQTKRRGTCFAAFRRSAAFCFRRILAFSPWVSWLVVGSWWVGQSISVTRGEGVRLSIPMFGSCAGKAAIPSGVEDNPRRPKRYEGKRHFCTYRSWY